MGAYTTAIVLAGGLGARLRPVVSDVPKPMAPVKGRPFLEYLLEYWMSQGVQKFVLSVGYKREVIRDHFGSRFKDAVIEYVIENRPLGTGGGLLLALKARGGSDPLLVLNGDTMFEVGLAALRAEHDRSCAGMTLALHETADDGRFSAVDMTDDGRITALHGRKAGAASHYVNGGVYVLVPGIFSNLPMPSDRTISLEDDLLPALIEQGTRVQGYPSKGRFIDIGLPADYLRLESWLAERPLNAPSKTPSESNTIGKMSE